MKRRKTIQEVMSSDVVCISEDTSLEQATHHITASTQSIFPVVDGEGKYKGFVSPLDLFRKCFPLDQGGVYPDLSAIFAEDIGALTHCVMPLC